MTPRPRHLLDVIASPRSGRGNPDRWGAASLDCFAALAMTVGAAARRVLSMAVVVLAVAGCGSSAPPPRDLRLSPLEARP